MKDYQYWKIQDQKEWRKKVKGQLAGNTQIQYTCTHTHTHIYAGLTTFLPGKLS